MINHYKKLVTDISGKEVTFIVLLKNGQKWPRKKEQEGTFQQSIEEFWKIKTFPSCLLKRNF